MKQVFQNYRTGALTLEDVPIPACKPGGVLVRSDYSAISAGTELMKVTESKLSLIGKARARPDHVRKLLVSAAQHGLIETGKKALQKLDSLTPLGYSVCGTVVEVGDGVTDFEVGHRVACAGNAHALHAEYNWVPVNLCVPVPAEVPPHQAAFATIGAIALQGIRQSNARLGETACVVGLGLIGQMLVQLLKASGIRAIGIDLSEERCRLSEQAGAVAAFVADGASPERLRAEVDALTDGFGCDHILLAASGDSSDPINLAVALARDRARVTVIGKTKIDAPWKDYYEKELEVLFSRSYGPGRYDPLYEEHGVDYPIGYVRWTERRNIECVLDLLARGQIDFAPLITAEHAFEDAVAVYERMFGGEISALGSVFRYQGDEAADRPSAPAPRAADKVTTAAAAPVRQVGTVLRLGVVGCGNYASSMLMPHLAKRPDVRLVAVSTTTPTSAANAHRRFGFQEMTTDTDAVMARDDIDAILIATRHSSHAALAAAALRAGKAVFVEKPLALSADELAAIRAAVSESGNARLMVGFNRRFAPLATALRDLWGPLRGANALHYRVNAGGLASGSWYADSAHEGSRFAGEGGHFIDFASWWFGAEPSSCWAQSVDGEAEDLVVTLRYPGGSLATISYLTKGDTRFPKERVEIFGQGQTGVLDNFRRVEVWRGGRRSVRRGGALRVDKGQRAQMEAFVAAALNGEAMPIPLESLYATTEATLAVADAQGDCRPLSAR